MSKYVLPVSIILGTIFAVARFNEFPVSALLDDAIYAEVAHSIAEGRGPVIYLHSRTGPQFMGAFPVGYPFLLSPIAFIFPESVQSLKLFSIFATVGMLVFFWVLLRKQTGTIERCTLLSLVALNPWTIAYSNRVLSEAIYGFLSLAAFAVFLKWLEQRRPSIPMTIGLSVLLGLTASTRSIGLSLIAAMVCYLLATRKWIFLGAFVASAVLGLVPQGIINYRVGNFLFSPGYQAQLLSHSPGVYDRLLFMWSNFTGYLGALPAVLLPVFGTNVSVTARAMGMENAYTVVLLVSGCLIVVFILLGGLLGKDRKIPFARVSLLYCLFFGLALLNFSGNGEPVQSRLLVPLIPILYETVLSRSVLCRSFQA